MNESQGTPGWYYKPGDPANTQRYWNGQDWMGAAQPNVDPPQSTGAPIGDAPAAPSSSAPPTGTPQVDSTTQAGFTAPTTAQDGAPGADAVPGAGAIPGADAVPGAGAGAGAVPGLTGSQNQRQWPLVDPQKRLLARGIDVIAWGLLAMTLFWGPASTFFIAAVGAFVYEVYMVGTQGRTLGKRLTGLKIVREDGAAIDPMTAATRMAVFGGIAFLAFVFLLADLRIIAIVLFLAGLGAGAFFIFSDPNQRTPWDQISKTVVVKN